MINSVRNTVLSVLNKNNYGYISPSDFNLFAKQAQIEIFESYFSRYNYQINKENARKSGTDDANIAQSIAETIEKFSTSNILLPIVDGEVSHYMTLPEDYFMIQKMNYHQTILSSGGITSPATAGQELRDSGATFTTDGISQGDIAVNLVTGEVAYVISVVSDIAIHLTRSIYEDAQGYAILSLVGVRPIEKVSQSKITLLTNSNHTAPTVTYPAYVLSESESTATGEIVALYPLTIAQPGSVVIQYIRYPREPKWTYSDVPSADGEPLFDSTQSDYQDFELPILSEHTLVLKILEYAGISIREDNVVGIAAKLEDRETNLER